MVWKSSKTTSSDDRVRQVPYTKGERERLPLLAYSLEGGARRAHQCTRHNIVCERGNDRESSRRGDGL